MTVRKLSLQLDIDSGKFTIGARDATGAVKTLKAETTSLSAALKAADSAFNGSITSARNYVATISKLTSSKAALKTAQREYIAELVRELDTLGMSNSELREYEARQLGITTKSKALRDAIDKKAKALEDEADAIRKAKDAEELRAANASNLVSRLKEELILTRDGQEALEMYRAEQLGVTNEVRALIQQKAALVAKNKAEADSLRKAADAARDKSEAERKAAYELSQHMRTIEAMEWAIDGEVASLKRKEAALKAVAAAQKAGEIGPDQAARYTQYAEEQHANYVQSQKKGGGLKNHQVANLSYQVNDVVSGLLMGQSPGMIAMQQGGQILQIFQQSGTGALGVIRGLASALGSLLVPLASVAAVLAPVAAGFALIARNQDSIKMMREFNGLLAVTVTDGKATGAQLTQLSRDLDVYGGSLKDIKAEIGIFLKEGIRTDLFDEFGKTAEHVSKVLGIDLKDAASQTAKAFSGGWEQVKQLDQALNFLTLEEAKHIKALFDSGKAAQARNEAFRIFSEKYAKAYNESLTDGDRLTKALAGAWDTLVSTMANIQPVIDATNGIKNLIIQMTNWLAKYSAVKNLSASQKVTERERVINDIYKIDTKIEKGPGFLEEFAVQKELQDSGKRPLSGDAKRVWKQRQLDERSKLMSRLTDLNSSIAEDEKPIVGDTVSEEQNGKNTFYGKKDGDKTKANPGKEGLSALESQLAGLKAQLQDTGSEYAKYKSLLSDPDSTLSRHVKGNKVLAEQYLAVAKAIDEANKKLKEKRELDKLREDASAKATELSITNRNISNILGATGGDDIERARYASRIDQNVIDAGNTEEAKAAGEKAKASDAENARRGKVATLAEDIVKANEAAKASADSLWAQITQGTNKLDKDIAAIESKYAKLISETTGEDQQKAIDRKNKLIGDTMRANIADLVVGWERESKEINATLVEDKQKAAKELLAIDVEMYRKQIEAANLSVEEKKRALEALNNWYAAEAKKIAQNDPFAVWINENARVGDKLKSKSLQWLDVLTDGLASGKGKFSNFARDVGDEIEFLVKKALMAKYIVEPIMSLLGLDTQGVKQSDSIVSGKAIGDVFSSSAGALKRIMSGIFKGTPTTAGGTGGTDWLGTIAKGIGSFFGFPAYHTGGVAGQELAMMRYADPSIFIHAPRFHTGRPIPGLSSDELPAILKKDEGVFTKQQMKALGDAQRVNQAPNVAINIENQTGQPVDADTGGMSFDGEKWVTNVVLSQLSRPGPMRDAFKSAQNGR